MIGRLRWSNQNSSPRGERPYGSEAVMWIANTGASPLRDTTYPSLAPETLQMEFGTRNYGLNQKRKNDCETRFNSASDICAKRESLLHLPENGLQIAT